MDIWLDLFEMCGQNRRYLRSNLHILDVEASFASETSALSQQLVSNGPGRSNRGSPDETIEQQPDSPLCSTMYNNGDYTKDTKVTREEIEGFSSQQKQPDSLVVTSKGDYPEHTRVSREEVAGFGLQQQQPDLIIDNIDCKGDYSTHTQITKEEDMALGLQQQPDLLVSSAACSGKSCATIKVAIEDNAPDFQQEQHDSLFTQSMSCGKDYIEREQSVMDADSLDVEGCGDSTDTRMQGDVSEELCESGIMKSLCEFQEGAAVVADDGTLSEELCESGIMKSFFEFQEGAVAVDDNDKKKLGLNMTSGAVSSISLPPQENFEDVASGDCYGQAGGPDDGRIDDVAKALCDMNEASGIVLEEKEHQPELSSVGDILPSSAFEEVCNELSSIDDILPSAAFHDETLCHEEETSSQRAQNLLSSIDSIGNLLHPLAIGPPRQQYLCQFLRTDPQSAEANPLGHPLDLPGHSVGQLPGDPQGYLSDHSLGLLPVHPVGHSPSHPLNQSERIEAYCESISDDLLEFMNFRQMCEDEELNGSPTQLSLEERRKDYKDVLPHLPPLVIRRQNAAKYVLDKYKNTPNFHKQKLMVKYYDDSRHGAEDGEPYEEGIDVDGMTRDLFANIWNISKHTFKKMVPLSLGYTKGYCPDKCQCELFGKAVFHSYLLTRQIPKYLPKLAVMGMFCSVDNTTDLFVDNITEVFVNEQVPIVKGAIQEARSVGISEKDSEQITLLSDQYDAKLPPPRNPRAFEEWLRALVLDACVNNPNHFVTIFSKLREEILGYSTPSDAQEMFQTLRPMRSDVIDLLQPVNGHTIEKKRAFDFLKSFLSSCALELVNLFLLFCTGSDSLTEPSIEVEFYSGKGYLLASTCFSTIKIPTGYDQFEDFQEKMTEALSHPENFRFNRA